MFCVIKLNVGFSSAVEPTLPIPNRVLKHSYADDTGMQIPGKVSQSRFLIIHSLKEWFFFCLKTENTSYTVQNFYYYLNKLLYFMDKDELRNLPKQESETLEYKENTSEKEKAGADIAAMANKSGGSLYFGVKDNGDLINKISANGDVQIREISNYFFDNIKPSLPIEVLPLNCNDWKGIKINIPETQIKHYTWQHKPYIRIGSTTRQMGHEEYRRRLNLKTEAYDWSAQLCEGATVEDLDEDAIKKAKEGYIEKNYKNNEIRVKEIQNYDIKTFLNEAKLNINNKITKTTILLLGKEKSVHYLNTMAEILWEENGTEAYKKFRLPFIFAIDNLANHIRIRDIEYPVYMGGQQTGQHGKIANYTFKNLREVIANCVAHQNYEMQEKIWVYESVDKIEFRNAGKPLLEEDNYNELLKPNGREFAPTTYRNKWLYEAMDTVGLVEGRGSGFRKIFDYSTKSAFLPAPTANFDLSDRFEYTIYGNEIDPVFTKILIEKKDLDIGIILLLDRVQKYNRAIIKKQISKEQQTILKKLKLVEGRYPKLYLSFELEKLLGNEEHHNQNELKANFRNIFETTVLIWLKKHKDGKNKQEIIDYTLENLPIAKKLPPAKLKKDIENSLQKLKGAKLIRSKGSLRTTKYFKT